MKDVGRGGVWISAAHGAQSTSHKSPVWRWFMGSDGALLVGFKNRRFCQGENIFQEKYKETVPRSGKHISMPAL